ncbi:ABC transporter permease [Streptomyces sp. NPDC000410]|uniref:ABC transporter permease n=1 Tax=Streptomyces sp. NPDC000410 TaxID=3154254 RepID=UPI0033220935
MKTDLRHAAITMAAVALSGIALGLLWLWLAPRVPWVSTETALFADDAAGEQAAGADATFALLAVGFGVLSAAAVFWIRRRGGVALVIGLALGGLLASALAWGVAVLIGPSEADVIAQARAADPGSTFEGPLELHSYAALLAWPVAAMLVHLALTALFGPRDPEPEWPMPGPQPPLGGGPS